MLQAKLLASTLLMFTSVVLADLTRPLKPSITLLEINPTDVSDNDDSVPLPHQETDQSYVSKALDYEQYFYGHFDTFKENTDVFYTNASSSDIDYYWTKKGTGSASTGYGGLTGVRLYHLYDEMFALGRMVRFAYDRDLAHADDYKNYAIQYVREYVPRLVNGTGTQHCGAASSSYYCNASPQSHRFLDATRGLAWLGFLMESVLISDDSYLEEFKGYADDLRPVLDRFISRASNPAVTHMASHPALAAYALGKVGDYLSAYEQRIVDAINDAIIGNISKSDWVGSDVGHAEMSINFMYYVYEKQLRNESLDGAGEITVDHLREMGRAFVDRIDEPNPTAIKFEDNIVGEYGLLVKYSEEVAEKSGGSPDVYSIGSPTGSHTITEPLSSVASIAYGYFLK